MWLHIIRASNWSRFTPFIDLNRFFNSTHVALDVLGMCPISPVYKFQRMIHCTVLEIGYGSTNTRISMVALILE